MIVLDACTSFCTSLQETLGPTLTELLMFAAVAALAWWRARKAIGQVEKKASAGIASAHEQASKAKAEAREAKLSLARIEGSLRPSTPSGEGLPAIVGSPMRPPPLDPEAANLPAPSAVPSFGGPTTTRGGTRGEGR